MFAQDFATKAGEAYAADKYNEAIELYNKAIEKEGISSDLYYNLGNAYYKSGFLGKAVVCYERAISLNPRNEEAKINLEFVNSKIADKFIADDNIVDSFAWQFMSLATPNGWAIVGIICFLLLLGAIALYVFNDHILLRKIGFFGGFVFLFLCIVANVVSAKLANRVTNSGCAVVMKNVTILSTSPREPKSKAEEAFLLHEGAKVKILDSVSVKVDSITTTWYDVTADEAHRAWIRGTDIERI